MSYIRIERQHTSDERWITAGSDAFALHIAALAYCDQQLSEGLISPAMATRVSNAVPERRAKAAIATLVSHGFWQATDDGYLISKFDDHAIPADQQLATRARWKADKDRRRQHKHGDHSLCKDSKFCPAIRDSSTVEKGVEARRGSTRGGSPLNPTQPDPTQLDSTGGRGEEGEGEVAASGSDARSAPLAGTSPPPAAPGKWLAPTPPPGRPIAFTINGKEVSR